MSDFVLEVGVENVPASYLPPAVAQARIREAAAHGRRHHEAAVLERLGVLDVAHHIVGKIPFDTYLR